MDINYILNEHGEDRANYFHAVAPPIIRSSNFAFKNVAHFRAAILDEMDSHVYTRGNNPTVEILRKKIAALEKTEDALLTASGSAAISAAIMAIVSQGDHVICVKNPYSWTKSLLTSYLPRFGVETTYVEGTNPKEIFAAIKSNTKVLYLESPNTFTFEIQDLSMCAQWATQHGIVSMIDNSYCSPIFQQPADFGIDLVLHSVTKYINGHSDIVAGVICGSKEHLKRIFFNEYMTLGAILSPADAAWILRAIRTLPIRMERIHDTTMEVVKVLKKHPKVERMYYPFDPDFPQYALAKKQMTGSGGLFTIAVKDSSIEKINLFVDKLKRFKLAVSWGGHESLILPIAPLYHLEGRNDPHIPFNYVRVYIGLEDADYLLEELLDAMEIL
jgi:cystathionine beta-lyase/cystathionine gamma-synthase